MNLSSLKTLTWATVAAAIGSALALAAVDPVVEGPHQPAPLRQALPPLPAEPTAAGPAPARAASATVGAAGGMTSPAVL